MKPSRNKKVSNKAKMYVNPTKILKVKVYTSIAKPLNGALPRSNNSHLLRLYPITYRYKIGKEEKEATVQTYYLKGVKGIIRHEAMNIFHNLGIEGCHSSEKTKDKEGNSLIPEGFHPSGYCRNNGGECLIHQIFGSIRQRSLISISIDPIASITHKTAILDTKIQNVHLATENRVNLSFEGKSIQDYGEKYFSGDFYFEIDVSQLNYLQLGFLIQSVIHLKQLGRGYNAGYGHLEVKEFQLLKRKNKKMVKWNEDSFKVIEELQEESLKEEVLQALQEWEKFVSTT